MKTIEDYHPFMTPCYKNDVAFKMRSNAICYIPENAEDLDEAFTYKDLVHEVVVWLQGNEDYLIEHETTIEDIVENMYISLSWEFPSTYLFRLDY